jgi:hypothetical protein
MVRIRGLMERLEQADREHADDPSRASLGVLEKLRRIGAANPAGTR